MAFVTASEIKAYRSRQKAAYYHIKSASDRHYIFLSHSHQDKHLIEKFVELIGDQGSAIYIDWADETMPKVCSPVTAARIKRKINECHKLVLFATDNACASRWCPWELGVADEAKGHDDVLVFPVIDPPHTWKGNEYIGIYDYAERDSLGNLYVSSPIHGKMYIKLSNWLTR